MGRVSAPFGVKGWIKIQPFTAETASLLRYREWWVGRGEEWRLHSVSAGHEQGKWLVAKLKDCDDRDTASALRGRQLAVTRDALPELPANEYYWADLIGLRVVNGERLELGVVSGILETGANEVLVVKGECERLIPFIAEVVRQVDLERGVIRVDWGADY